MGTRYDDLTALLERFDWLTDSLVYSVSLEGNLRYDIRATLLIRVIDDHDGFSDKVLKLVLSDVIEFKLAQIPGFAAFETSQGASIGRHGDRFFLELNGPEAIMDGVPANVEWKPAPRHLTAEEIRKRGFYLDFTDFTAEILPAVAVADGAFGSMRA